MLGKPTERNARDRQTVSKPHLPVDKKYTIALGVYVSLYMRFIEGTPRNQSMLLPASLDEYEDTDKEVRSIDLFVTVWIWSKRVLH